MSVRWSWNLLTDIQVMWSYPFMLNAFRAGTIVAVVAAMMGWFMVLRRQSFAGHTLAVVAFPGAAGATLLALPAAAGFFGFAVAGAAVIAVAPGGHSRRGFGEESALIGTVQAFALACGFLFAGLYAGFLSGLNALLFGTFLGITTQQVLGLAVAGLLVVVALAVIGRPLLFASLDPAVAAARGVPTRALGVAFLLLLGVAAAATSQVTGALLVFALLVLPAATAQRLTARPLVGLGAGVAIGLAVTWIGLTLAFYLPYPIGFFVTTLAFGAYVLAQLAARMRPAG